MHLWSFLGSPGENQCRHKFIKARIYIHELRWKKPHPICSRMLIPLVILVWWGILSRFEVQPCEEECRKFLAWSWTEVLTTGPSSGQSQPRAGQGCHGTLSSAAL